MPSTHLSIILRWMAFQKDSKVYHTCEQALEDYISFETTDTQLLILKLLTNKTNLFLYLFFVQQSTQSEIFRFLLNAYTVDYTEILLLSASLKSDPALESSMHTWHSRKISISLCILLTIQFN